MKKQGFWGLFVLTVVFVAVLVGVFVLRHRFMPQLYSQTLLDLSTEAADKPEVTGLIDLNTASLRELMVLPGIGVTIAQRILDYRAANGGFRSMEELKTIKGISQALFESIADYITVGGAYENSGS